MTHCNSRLCRRWLPIRRRGMSLVELLVVMAIVGVLSGLLLPAVQRVRDSSQRVVCLDHLKQIGVALHHYHDAYHVLPPGVSYQNGKDPHPHMSWLVRILPYIEQESLWARTLAAYKQDPFFRNNPPHVGLSTVVPLFTCPTDGRTKSPKNIETFEVAFTSYLGVEGINQKSKDGMLYLDSKVRFGDVADGLGQTLLAGERPPSANLMLGWWYGGWGQSKDGSAEMVLGVAEMNVMAQFAECGPGPFVFGPGQFHNPCDVYHYWSPHFGGGGHFLMGDGSARFIGFSAASILPALATRAAGEAALGL